MDSSNESAVRDEVEVLRAIYGDEKVSFEAGSSESLTSSISIHLESLLTPQPHPAGSTVTISALLPSTYPSDALPLTPTLRTDGLPAAACAAIVQRMLSAQPGHNGAVCLFEYCSALVEELNNYTVGDGEGNEEDSHGAGESGGKPELPSKQFKVFHGEAVSHKMSVFQAHAAVIESEEDVDAVMQQLRCKDRKLDTATHSIAAWRVVGKDGRLLEDADDDGEKKAGKGVLYVLQQLKVVNIVCVVSRWYGGVKLGPARFRCINRAARAVVEQHLDAFRVQDGATSAKR